MGVIRKFAIQGHAIPKGMHRPNGPFPPEIFASNPRAEEEDYSSDSIHEALDDVKMYKCKYCGEVIFEYELDYHECDEEEE